MSYVRWKPEQCSCKHCPCVYPRCKVSKDENLDLILDLMDEYVECRESIEKGRTDDNS